MQKTTTLKDFKVFLLKTFLSILVLSISFKASFGQEGALSKPASAKKGFPTERPAVQANQKAAVQERPAAKRLAASAAMGTFEASDVPAVNKQIAEKFSKNPGLSQRIQATSSTPVPNGLTDVCTFSGSLASTDLTLNNGRFFRDGVASVCGSTKVCPGPFGTGPYYYDAYTFTNQTCSSQCVTVTYNANGTTGDVFSVAYLGSFNPANLCTNYIADGGLSSLPGSGAVTYNFTLAANATVVIVVNGAQIATACDSYSLVVSGINCAPPPACTSPTSSVLSQAQIPGPPVNLINEQFDGVIPAAGWPVQNLSNPIGVTGWSQTNSLVFPPQSGAGFASANFNNTAGVGTISNWMFSPNITLKNGDRFSFYTRTTTGTFPDRLQLRQSTNGASVNVGTNETTVGDFTTLLLDINPNLTGTGYPTAWTQFSVTMSGLPAAGISGRLAFRYFVTSGGPAGANSDFIGIDNAVYTSFTQINPTTCTGSTANLKVDITGGSSPTYKVVIGAAPAAPGFPRTITGYVSGANIPVTPSVTTTYNLVSVVAEDNCTCVGTGNTGTPTVTVSPTVVAPITISAAPSTPLCAGDPTLLTVIGAPTSGTATVNSGPITVAIPDGIATGVSTTLNVTGIPATATGTGASVNFNITHTWDSDLTIFLKSPNNQVLNLVNQRGGTGDNFVNTTISSTGTVSLGAPSAPPFTGTFAPDGNLAAPAPTGFAPTATTFVPLYNTTTLNGAWSLGARDLFGSDAGTITSWGITVNYNVPAGPPVGYTFLWSPAAGLSSTTNNPVGASPMSTTTYTVMGTAPNGCQTTGAITINVNQLPAVTTPPSNITVCGLSNAVFSITGSGAGITYQWQVSTTGVGGPYTNISNGAQYSGVTTNTLTVIAAPSSFNGYRYRCVVSGICPPSANSSGALLTVNDLPVIAITPGTPVCGGLAGTNGTLITAGSSAPPVPGTATFSSGAINVPIPEGAFPAPPATAATNVIAVSGIPANATITNVSVTSNITHPFVGDVVMVLKAPNGAVFNLDALLNKTNNSGANFVNTVISSTGTTTLDLGVAPFTGTFKADAVGATFSAFGFTLAGGPTGFAPTTSNWSGLYSTPNGNWTIAAYDAGAPDLGNLTSWSLKIDYTTPGGTGSPLTYTWSPALGLYSDPNAVVAYIAGTQTNQVYAAPSVNTVYTVTGTNGVTGCVNTGTVGVTYTPKAPIVTPPSAIVCSTYNKGVRLATNSKSSITNLSFSSGTISVPVVDNNIAGSTSSITASGVPANATIKGMNVSFNMTHTWAGDVVVVLKAPNGKVLNLDYFLNATGGTGATTGFANTVISSAGTASLNTGSGTYTGTFRPDARLTPAAGFGPTGPTGFTANVDKFDSLYSTPNGAYTLAMYDGFGGDAGTLTRWDLGITYEVGVPTVPAVWSPITGLYIDSNLTTAYSGQPLDTVWANPSATTTYSVTLTSVGPDSTKVFANPSSITINDGSTGSPYPATIAVSGLPTAGATVKSVTITGLSHTWSDDIDILLQSPTGTNVTLMSDVGGTAGLTNVNYTFADGAAAMSATVGNPTGTYGPTNNGAADNYPGAGPGAVNDPAPALSKFAGNANGNWKLFVVDDTFGDQGNISGGYSILFNYPTQGCKSAATLVPVTVNIPLTFNPALPANAAVCTDKAVSFTASVSGTIISHNWKVSTQNGNAGTWTNVVNGGVYSGANTATLTITAPPLSMNGYVYKDSIRTAGCRDSSSRFAVLTVNPLPTISIAASPYQKLFPGLTTTLSSTVSPLARVGGYSWLRNGTAVSGANASTLLVGIDQLGDYRLMVTDTNGCVNTSSMTVSITDSISSKVFIYPNPNSGMFQVRYYSVINNAGLPRGVNVYNSRGTRVLTQAYSINSPYARMDIDLSNQSTGVYWIEVVDTNGNRLAMGRADVIR